MYCSSFVTQGFILCTSDDSTVEI